MRRLSTAPSEESVGVTRRRVLVAGVGGAVTLAGCSGTVDLNLDDVLVSNDTPHPVSGSVTAQDPGDGTVLDETFELSVKTTTGGGTGNATTDTGNRTGENATGNPSGDSADPTATYSDIFTGSGEYTVAVELDEGSEIRGVSGTEQTVTVSDTEEQSIVVGLGSGRNDLAGEFAGSDVQLDDPIWVAVSDGQIEFDVSANNGS